MFASNAWVTVGKIEASFGIQGWVKIRSYTDPITNIFDYSPWQLIKNGEIVPAKLEKTKKNNKSLIAKFQNIDSPETAAVLFGSDITVPRDVLPILPDDEFYWSDLEGLTVINLQGITLGTVKRLMATGANDVLIISGEREYLIPYVLERHVKSIDLKNRQIIVDWDAEF